LTGRPWFSAARARLLRRRAAPPAPAPGLSTDWYAATSRAQSASHAMMPFAPENISPMAAIVWSAR
jgi:hypothetical protein